MSKLKAGDRVKHKVCGKGTILKINTPIENGYDGNDLCFNLGLDKPFLGCTETWVREEDLKRLVKKKKPTREPERVFVNRYSQQDGSILLGSVAYCSVEIAQAWVSSKHSSYIETVEFVEVLKRGKGN